MILTLLSLEITSIKNMRLFLGIAADFVDATDAAGILAALRRNSLVDVVATLVAIAGVSLPSFWEMNEVSRGMDVKPLFHSVQAAEKVYQDFTLTATNPGGHSSVPRPDNAHLLGAVFRRQFCDGMEIAGRQLGSENSGVA